MKLKSWKEIPKGGTIISAGNSEENHTGSWSFRQPKIDNEKCIRCGLCVGVCPEQCIKMKETKEKPVQKEIQIDYDYCKGCFLCQGACPKDAIK